MKTTSIVCAILAGTLGFGTLASAQDWRHGRQDRNVEQQRSVDQLPPGSLERLREANDRIMRQQAQESRDWDNRQQYQQRGYTYNQPRYGYNQPRYYAQAPRYYDQAPRYYDQAPRYYDQAPRYYRGGYLPREYLSSNYYVNNWQAYPGLYAPPYGYQWVDTGSDFVLAALATGLIANLLTH